MNILCRYCQWTELGAESPWFPYCSEKHKFEYEKRRRSNSLHYNRILENQKSMNNGKPYLP